MKNCLNVLPKINKRFWKCLPVQRSDYKGANRSSGEKKVDFSLVKLKLEITHFSNFQLIVCTSCSLYVLCSIREKHVPTIILHTQHCCEEITKMFGSFKKIVSHLHRICFNHNQVFIPCQSFYPGLIQVMSYYNPD